MRNSTLRINREAIVVGVLFLICLLNSSAYLVAMILVSLYLIASNRRGVGAVKALLFISARSIVSIGTTSGSMFITAFKWIVIFGLSLICYLADWNRVDSKGKTCISSVMFLGLVFISVAFFTSGYPVTSACKVFSWCFVFCGIMCSIISNLKVDWIRYISYYFTSMIILSPIALLMGIAYRTNGYSFQGFFNHPNLLGVASAVCFAVHMYSNNIVYKKWHWIVMFISVFECWFSKSRTGLFSIAILFLINTLVFSEKGVKRNISIVIMMLISVLFLISPLKDDIHNYIFKGGQDILSSRQVQIDSGYSRFENNILFGSGFMTPINKSGKDYSLDFSLMYEPGNLFITLLGDVGFIGSLLFYLVYYKLYRLTNKNDRVLFAIPFVISMGEMAFFSTNSIAIFYYVLLALSIAGYSKSITSDKLHSNTA